MKRLIVGLLGVAATALTLAESVKAEQARQLIQEQRLRQEVQYEQALAGCYSRFAVNDCILGEKNRRRASLDVLRRQEASLNEQERLSRVAAQREAMSEKSSPEKREQAELAREVAQSTYQKRLTRAQEKAAVATQSNSGRVSAINQNSAEVHVTALPAAGASAAEKNRRYLEKMSEARDHRADREKARAEMTGMPAKSLPSAP